MSDACGGSLANNAKYPDAVSRERYWDEGLTAEQKIERLHDAVTSMMSQLRKVDDLLQALMQHQHLPTGQMVQPVAGTPENRYPPEPLISRYCDHSLRKMPRA